MPQAPVRPLSQVEYRAYANVFSQLGVGISPEAKKTVDAINKDRKDSAGKNNNQVNQIKEVYLGGNVKKFTHPDTGAVLAPQALGGPTLTTEKGKDLRAELHQWLTQPENPFFARSFVNRVWGHYFGIGIVQPVDDFSLGNPASNQKLLDALAQEFKDKKYDIRHIERVVLNSRTYQLSSKPNATNKLDRVNYARSYVRPMMAEAVVDVLTPPRRPRWPRDPARREGRGSRASQLRAVVLVHTAFGRPPRTTACVANGRWSHAAAEALPDDRRRPAAKFSDPKGRQARRAADVRQRGETRCPGDARPAADGFRPATVHGIPPDVRPGGLFRHDVGPQSIREFI